MRKVTRKEYAEYISVKSGNVNVGNSEDLEDGACRMVWRDGRTGKIKAVATYRKNPNTRHANVTYEIYK